MTKAQRCWFFFTRADAIRPYIVIRIRAANRLGGFCPASWALRREADSGRVAAAITGSAISCSLFLARADAICPYISSMTIQRQIAEYIASLAEPKRSEMLELHQRILKALPKCKQWFSDGRNSEGKVVSNPNIGYGAFTIKYADGSTKEFFQIGLSANTTGISVYVMGIEDKTYLANTYGKKLGKASVTGYCIKFKKLGDIDVDVLLETIRDGVRRSADSGRKP